MVKNRIKRMVVAVFAMFLCMLPVMKVCAAENRFVDNEGLVELGDAERINNLIDEVSERQQMDIVIVTVGSLEGKTATEYADDYYDYNGYGFGESKDGILLLISMEYRDWAISTTGNAIPAFTDAGQAFIIDRILPDLSEGNYSDCFIDFINWCDKFMTQAKTGSPYDVGELPKEPFSFFGALITSLVVGIIVSVVMVFVLKGQLTSVSKMTHAADYVRKNSLKVDANRDVYLYSNVVKTALPKESSGGGSGTHISSSGSSHGGSSGKF